jgi:hypothetical protein
MKEIDVQKELLEEVEILGHMGLFTEFRVDKNTVPQGVHCYELRHGDDNSFPATLEERVTVNYFGSIILLEKLELENGRLWVPYEEFSYTGERMKLEEFQQKDKQEEPKLIQTSNDLVEFLESHDILFSMTEKEAEVLLGYLGGHGYLLGEQEGRLFRGDLSYGQNYTLWEEHSIDDAIDSACEWNYELLQTAEKDRENPDDFFDFIKKNTYYESLREEEQILSAVFDRTKYGKEVQSMAERLANEFIQSMEQKGIGPSVKELAEQIADKEEGQEVREEMLYGSEVFEYQGYHFKPLRQFDSQTEDFFSVTRALRSDTDLGFFAADYGGQQKRDYNYEEFYKASTDKKADVFLYMENGKTYVPCGYELQEYVKETSKAMPERGKIR